MAEALVDLSKVGDALQEIQSLPGDLLNINSPVNIRKTQPRARYWRPLQNGEWAQTSPLPADTLSILHYFSKGFKGSPPTKDKTEEVDLTCACGFKAASAFGLQVHQRKHKE